MNEARPNIIMLVADTHRGRALRHLGGSRVRTPFLDTLAASGVSFTQMYGEGAVHHRVGVASRASLVTGRSSPVASADPSGLDSVAARTIPESVWTIPERARDLGFMTYMVGKWSNDRASLHRSFQDGDAIDLCLSDVEGRALRHRHDRTGHYAVDEATVLNGNSDELVADAAVRFLHQWTGSQPFLLYVSFTMVEDDDVVAWMPKASQLEAVSSLRLAPMIPGFAGRSSASSLAQLRAEARAQLARYYARIARLDHAVGRVLRELEARQFVNRTAVIYTADRGVQIGEQGIWGGGTLYEETVRVPLIMRGPGIPQNVLRSGLVTHRDVGATIAAMIGVPRDPELSGISVLPLRGKATTVRNQLGLMVGYGHRAIIDGHHKLIQTRPLAAEIRQRFPHLEPGGASAQVFDLREDAREDHDLSDHPAMHAQRRRLEQRLLAWQRAINDPVLAFE